MNELMTGHEWNEKRSFPFYVIDPDGWDRKTDNFRTEQINQQEFINRAMLSTLVFQTTGMAAV